MSVALSLVSPCCKAAMRREARSLTCEQCGWKMPVIGGIPVLIYDDRSVFSLKDFAAGKDDETGVTYHDASILRTPWRRFSRKAASLLSNRKAPTRWFSKSDAMQYVCRVLKRPRILIVGAGILRSDVPEADLVHTDASLIGGLDYVCDAHDLPFADESFDMVVAVAILEHVADPSRCVSEFYRVLKPSGYVHAESPFLQPVHMGQYDFTRFTPLGHRRLFRRFETIEAGMALGPGSVLAWAIRYWILSLTDNIALRRWLRAFGLLITMPVRKSDIFFKHKRGAQDAAGGSIFFGRKSPHTLSDREILAFYVGRDQVYD
jgi:SAM-dependent methyltransferase